MIIIRMKKKQQLGLYSARKIAKPRNCPVFKSRGLEADVHMNLGMFSGYMERKKVTGIKLNLEETDDSLM